MGLCPLHHVVGVVHVPLAPSLRYSPSCDPVYPSDTAKAARARLLGLCCFLPPVLLPSRASALSCLASLHLSPSPRALVLLLCLPAIMVLCLGWCLWLLLLCVFGLSSWRGLFFVLFGLFGFVVLFVPGWFLCFVFCCWWLLCWTGTLVYFAFTCALRPLSQLD